MGKLVCELCGSSDLIKSEGVFVCQSCGAKYSVEEARQMMFGAEAAQPEPVTTYVPTPTVTATPRITPTTQQVSNLQDLLLGLASLFTHDPAPMAARSAADVNNYVCRGWEKLVRDYKAIEHPTKEQHAAMLDRAKECLAALDGAAASQPDEVVQAAIIYLNCKEIVESMRDLKYHVKNDKDGWDRKGMGAFDKLELPRQSASWDEKYQEQHDILAAEYLRQNPDAITQRAQLCEREDALSAQLSELKDEKRGKGFFNFDAKREVKERMAPVQAELSDVRSQIRAIDNAADKYVRQCIESLRGQFTMLDF